jgi:hypothetical protein
VPTRTPPTAASTRTGHEQLTWRAVAVASDIGSQLFVCANQCVDLSGARSPTAFGRQLTRAHQQSRGASQRVNIGIVAAARLVAQAPNDAAHQHRKRLEHAAAVERAHKRRERRRRGAQRLGGRERRLHQLDAGHLQFGPTVRERRQQLSAATIAVVGDKRQLAERRVGAHARQAHERALHQVEQQLGHRDFVLRHLRQLGVDARLAQPASPRRRHSGARRRDRRQSL